MALCIERKEGESFRVGHHITITVYDTRRGRCKLAIAAPPELTILRSELRERPR